jgi:hypothetical protein
MCSPGLTATEFVAGATVTVLALFWLAFLWWWMRR